MLKAVYDTATSDGELSFEEKWDVVLEHAWDVLAKHKKVTKEYVKMGLYYERRKSYGRKQ